MAPKPSPAPDQDWRDRLDAALLRRLWRRAEQPGLAWPWQAEAMIARHRRMVHGLPLAQLLQRRAEILADGRAAPAPIVYARPATLPVSPWPDGVQAAPASPVTRPPAAGPAPPGPGSQPVTGPAGADREKAPSRPLVHATAAAAVPRPSGSPADAAPNAALAASRVAAQVLPHALAAPAAPAGTPMRPGPPATRSLAEVRPEAMADPAAVLPQPLVGLAGWVYFLIGPAAAFQGSRRGRRRRRLESKAGAVTA